MLKSMSAESNSSSQSNDSLFDLVSISPNSLLVTILSEASTRFMLGVFLRFSAFERIRRLDGGARLMTLPHVDSLDSASL